MLRVWIGPMFAGKTERLLVTYERIGPTRMMLVKPRMDTRSAVGVIESHTGRSAPAIELENTVDIPCDTPHSFVGIDEGQFFTDLTAGVAKLLCFGKSVIVCALNGTFEQKPWRSVSEIVPMADDVAVLSADCSACKREDAAKYTVRLGDSKELVLIGGPEKYVAMCRKCLLKR